MIPAIAAERWRLMESKLRQYEVDIQRLWRMIQDIQAAGTQPGHSGEITPDDLEIITGCTPAFEIRLWYHPSGGTFTVVVIYNSVTASVTIPYNADEATVKAAIDAHSGMVSAGKTCAVTSNGDLPRASMFVAMPEGAIIEPGNSSGLTPNASTGHDPDQTVTHCKGCA